MDQFDVPEVETHSESGSASEKAEVKDTDAPQKSNFDDIFGDSFNPTPEKSGGPELSTTEDSKQLFSLDEDVGNLQAIASAQGTKSVFDSLQEVSGTKEPPASGSLFDDLLDFSTTPKVSVGSGPDEKSETTSAAVAPESEPSRPVANVDLLVGVDHDLDSPSGSQPEAKANNPDILDFIDAPDLPEVDSMDITASPSIDLFDGVKDMKKEKSPDIVVTRASLNMDVLDGADNKSPQKTDEETPKAEEKKDESGKEKPIQRLSSGDDSDKVDGNKNGTSDQDWDFSVLELPESALNFDVSKHKRSLSKKGSFANRKKPKRSAIVPGDEDSIYQDSTEPKPAKPPEEDETNGTPSSGSTGGGEGNLGQGEASPTLPKKITGGMKIPGLLEGLNKTKVFARSDNSSEPAAGKVTSTGSPRSASPSSSAATPPTTAATATTQSITEATSSPLIRPKPVALPRVLPKPSSKILKESQNRNAAEDSAAGENGNQPTFMRASPGVVRSSSLRVASVSTISKDSLLNATRARVMPPKPEIQNAPLDSVPSKPAMKVPPPVASKPTVAAKPRRAGLGYSASFHGGRSPGLSVLSSEKKMVDSTDGPEQKPSPFVKRPTSVLPSSSSTKVVPVDNSVSGVNKAVTTGLSSVSSDAKSKIANFDSEKKPLPKIAQKTSENQSSTYIPDNKNFSTPAESSVASDKNRSDKVSSTTPFKESEPTGLLDRVKFTPGEGHKTLEQSKIEKFDVDDVFDMISKKDEKISSSSAAVSDSTLPSDKPDHVTDRDTVYPPRKSSVSGVTPVRSPSIGDKPSSAPRKGSITSSAYNPIGFRPAVGSTDGESKSRGNSVSSPDGVSTTTATTAPTFLANALKPRASSNASSEGRRSRDGSFNSSTIIQLRKSPEKTNGSKSIESDIKPPVYPEMKVTIGLSSSSPGQDKNKNVTEETNKIIRDQSQQLKDSSLTKEKNGAAASGKILGTGEKKASSPWGVQLRKAEKKDSSSVKEQAKDENNASEPFNWRQRLSVRRKDPDPSSESEKAKTDSTPEWAKASIKRRQRLIESGVIKGEAK